MFGVSAHAVGWPVPRGGSQSVSDALAAYVRSMGGTIETAGYAASRPVATNATPEGREENRRVEILIIPKG